MVEFRFVLRMCSLFSPPAGERTTTATRLVEKSMLTRHVGPSSFACTCPHGSQFVIE